ncbi:hypothetical protein GYMLUDRAFT_466148 [Collybiopsis luxurians FD-317 M1]|uniref:Unplaced genomic scaffold GYMLUscaffold_16, whole genome shotgun sequence n=1 Tax=Collybiopsis luxurians FD-317 M1 TaxID=944289 RepID=A0A0D0BH98_9AGAR|nr:hypothetical protein GYMLUDRAFT_466148 [Collybiopsis luxurians FD-317 M1]
MALDSVPFALGPTYGAYYWSAVLCTSFWAITCIQVFIYFKRYSKDSRFFKFMVFSIWYVNIIILFLLHAISIQLNRALDTVHNAMIVAGVYIYLVPNFGDFNSFLTLIPIMLLEFLFQVLASTVTQGFFVWRIFQLTKSSSIKWLSVAIWIPFALLQIALCVSYIIIGLRAPTILTITSHPIYVVSITYLVAASAVDLTLSLVITLILHRRSSGTQFSSTSSMLKKLIIISINNGLWTAVFALLDLILYVVYPTTALYLIFDYMMCSLYTNTLLANLNARDYMASSLAPKVSIPSKSIPSHSSQSQDNLELSTVGFTIHSEIEMKHI